MKTELGTIYITDDGKRFVNKDSAIEHQKTMSPLEIKLPVYFSWLGDEDGDKIYDYESMSNALETNILKALHRDCIVEIKER